jgi:hypothetical protein
MIRVDLKSNNLSKTNITEIMVVVYVEYKEANLQ